MPQSLKTSELTPQELAFLDAFAYTGNKRQALLTAGYGNDLTKDQVFYKAGRILFKASTSQRWRQVLDRHQCSDEEVARRLGELLHSDDKRAALGAAQLILRSKGYLRETGQEEQGVTSIIFHIMQADTNRQLAEKALIPLRIPLGDSNTDE